MTITRREFAKYSGVGALTLATAGSSLFLSSCNLEQDILNWIPTGEAALNSILTVLSANGILIPPGTTTIVNLIEVGFNDLVAAVKEYQSTTPPPVGALAKLKAAFQAVTDQFGNFVSSLSGTASKILAIVISIAQVVISTIGGFITQLPAAASALARLNPGNASVIASPVHRTRRSFKKAVNSTLDAGKAQGVIVPASAYLPVSLFEHL